MVSIRFGIVFCCLFEVFLEEWRNEKFLLDVVCLFFGGKDDSLFFGLYEILGIFLKLIRFILFFFVIIEYFFIRVGWVDDDLWFD